MTAAKKVTVKILSEEFDKLKDELKEFGTLKVAEFEIAL